MMEERPKRITAEQLLAMPIPEALAYTESLAVPSEALNDILMRLPNMGSASPRATILVAAMLLERRAATALAEFLQGTIFLLYNPSEALNERIDFDFARAILADIFHLLEIDIAHNSKRAPALVELGRVLARFARDADDPATAESVLNRALRASETVGNRLAIAVLYTDIGQHLLSTGELVGAVDHLARAADVFNESETAKAHVDFARQLTDILLKLAFQLYYEAQQFQLTVQVARRVTELSPDLFDGWFLLGNAQVKLDQYEAAAKAFRCLVKIRPDSPAAHTNLAAVLAKFGEEAEALRAVEESLRLAPHEVRPLLLRAQLRQHVGDLDGELADFMTALDLLEGDRPPDDSTTPLTTKLYRDHWEMWLLTYHNIIRIHETRREHHALSVLATRLKDTGDEALGAMGHRIAGNQARKKGELRVARHEYDAALQLFPHDHEARLARARLATELMDLDSAFADLAALASRQSAPKLAMTGLRELGERSADDPRLLRWLGFAQFEIGQFTDADANLAAYLETTPHDSEARRWYGLSLISLKPEDANTQPSTYIPRLLLGLDQLARSAHQGDSEASEAFLWLIDRLLLSNPLRFPIHESPSVAEAMPQLNELIRMLMKAEDHSEEVGRDLVACIETYRAVIDTGAQLKLSCFSAYQRAKLADVILLSGNFQSAAQEARVALHELNSIIYLPRTPELIAQFRKMKGRDSAYSADVGLELEHLHIYGLVSHAIDLVKVTTARILARTGDTKGASDLLDEASMMIANADQHTEVRATVIAEILRDVGRGKDALALLDRVEVGVKEGNDRVHILAVRSTVLGKLGRLPEAIEALREAEPLVIGTRQWIVSLNLASAVYSAGLADEALNILSRIDIASSARSDLDRFKYHYLRASALEDVGDFKQAQEVAAKAIAVIEELRGKLRDLSLRSSWTTQQQAVYALAIRVTAQNGNASAAFDLLEKSRSRQLVDELAIGHAPLDEEGRRLEQRIKEVKQERDLLMSLDDSNAAGSTDPQRLASLRTLNPKLDILELDADGNQTISSEKLQRARLRATRVIEGMQSDIAQRRLNSAERLFGNVVGSHQVREMLARLT